MKLSLIHGQASRRFSPDKVDAAVTWQGGHLLLKSGTPLIVNYILAVAAIPRKWVRVKTSTTGSQGIILHPTAGSDLHVPLNLDFLYSKIS